MPVHAPRAMNAPDTQAPRQSPGSWPSPPMCRGARPPTTAARSPSCRRTRIRSAPARGGAGGVRGRARRRSNAIPTRAPPSCARRSRPSTGWTRRGSSTAPGRTKCCTSPLARSPGRATRCIYVRLRLRGVRDRDPPGRRDAGGRADDSDYATDVDAILACVTERTRIVYVANPNNPTGTFADRERDRAAARGAAEDGAARARPGLCRISRRGRRRWRAGAGARPQPNVLVTRTFSKIFGLAAERIGWGYGAAPLIDAMHRIRAPFNITIAGTGGGGRGAGRRRSSSTHIARA